ncbi:hypothetical protein M9H77_34794 [Catharanthus roseus]|uniref:Uncharacterized protein n=1 Tax=Catharanthus roseus TaxID=4058 RepID=A0ACB9ZN34_CATRO|nr:hypothetical protein M9H77_34794 [Catharanthus roseus]
MEEEYVDHSYLFETDILFDSKMDLVNWTRKRAKILNTYLIITRNLSKRRFNHRTYVILGCERREGRKKKVRLDEDKEDEEEDAPVKYRGSYEMKKCNCIFQLKGEKSYLSKRRFNRRPYVILGCECREGRKRKHNHKIGVYPHTHTQAARVTDGQLNLTGKFSRCQVAPRNIMASLLEKNPDWAVSYVRLTCFVVWLNYLRLIKQTIYNVRTKIKNKRMEGRNTIEEVFHQYNQRGYRCYWRNCEENNILRDIVIAHPVSILMMRTRLS